MSLDISIKQKGLFPKKLNYSYLYSICKHLDLSYGLQNNNFAYESYDNELDIDNKDFIIFNPKCIGRGFRFILKNKTIELSLNFPSTNDDLAIFYNFIKVVCDDLDLNYFVREKEKISINDIDGYYNNDLEFNRSSLIEFANMDGSHTVFGAIYPIVINKEIKDNILSNKMHYYTEFLHKKQKVDLFYQAPHVIKCGDGKTRAIYSFGNDVNYILPIEPYIPYAYHANNNIKIDEYEVYIIDSSNENQNTLKSISYEEFGLRFRFEDREPFDESHIIIKQTIDEIKKALE